MLVSCVRAAFIGAIAYLGPKAGRDVFGISGETADLVFGAVTVLTGVFGTLAGGLALDRVGGTMGNGLRICAAGMLGGHAREPLHAPGCTAVTGMSWPVVAFCLVLHCSMHDAFTLQAGMRETGMTGLAGEGKAHTCHPEGATRCAGACSSWPASAWRPAWPPLSRRLRPASSWCLPSRCVTRARAAP